MRLMMKREGGAVVELSIRVAPELKKRLLRAQAKKPHLSMNAFLNEMILSALDREAEAQAAKK